MEKVKPHVVHLVAIGYQVTFIASSVFRDRIEQIGAAFVEPSGWEIFNDDSNVTNFFIKTIPAQFEAIQKAVASSTAENPNKPVILLPESSFVGRLPGLLGAPGDNPNAVSSVGIFPILAMSIDTAPPVSGVLLDYSLGGRKRNQELNKSYIELWGPMQATLNEVLESLGARKIDMYRHNAIMSLSTIFIQLCSPSLEYPRSDTPPTLRFTGGLPRSYCTPGTLPAIEGLPSWWDEVIQNPEKKKIAAVSQGTMSLNYNNLIIPTLSALKDHPNLLILIAVGKKSATLPPSTLTPSNAHIADWIPFDSLLPIADIFISKGGYGSFQNALARGVPLVVAGPLFADKRDIADRMEWSDTGISLKTGMPSEEALRNAVSVVSRDERYRKRVEKMKGEIRGLDPMKIIADVIDEIVGY